MVQVAPNTTIPAPRAAFVDARTGLISKEWFLFLQNIFVRTGHGSIVDTVEDVQVSITSNVQEAQVAELRKELDGLYAVVATQEAQVAELIKTLQGLELVPTMPPDGGTDSVVVGPGTETEPSISTVVDTNTGVYFPTDNALAITTDGVERIRVRANGDVAINALAKLYFDGAKATGDTYIVESASNELSIYVNGSEALLVSAGDISFPGTVTPGAGFSGTATPPTSITVVNGIVTNMI